MINNNHVTNIFERLKQDDFKFVNETIGQFDVTVAMKKQFHISWFTIKQMNIFAIMGIADRVSKEIIHSFSKTALEYAKNTNTGFSRSMHSIVVSFSLLISSSIDDDARQWVQKKPGKHFRLFEIPIILDSRNNTLLFYSKTAGRSSSYYKFFQNFIQKYFNTINK